ncbi:MAG: hypothetical protein ACFFG0_15780 [Candidatus Thorarchaeota archaeon]
MYCEGDKKDKLKKRDHTKQKDQVNTDSPNQKTSKKISENSIINHNVKFFCINRPANNKLAEGAQDEIFIEINQEYLCESSETIISDDNEVTSSESVELINNYENLNQKEKIMVPEEKSFTEDAVGTSTPKKEKDETNSSASRSSTIESYVKNEPVWKYVYKFIEDNSEKLLFLKVKYDTDDEFFTYLSKLLIDKLSNKTRLLKNLHRNTIKALPKVIITIFLLYFQEIDSFTGDDLEKRSGMIGQYKKLRAIANYICVELPFIMGDIVERILEEKKEFIFRGKFFPSQENLCRLDKRLTPSRKMVKTISRWIQKNSDYQNLTELKQVVYEKKDKRVKEEPERFVLLDCDKFKHSKKLRKMCDKIIQENLDLNSYADIRRITGIDVTQYFRTDHRRYIKHSKFIKIQKFYGKPIPHKKFVKRFTTDKWIFLWQNSEGEPITKEQAIVLAARYLIKEILKYNTDDYNLDYINNVLGRNDFISALSERGIRYNELLVKLGLDLNSNPGRWDTLDWSLDGHPRSYEEALANASNYLNKLLVDYDYNVVKVPTQEFIVKYHEEFHGALKRYNFNFYEVLKKAGYPDDKFRKKWWLFDNDELGNPLKPQEQEEKIFQFFKEKILPIYMNESLIERNFGPSYDEAVDVLKDTEFHGFISAINARGVAHGNLLLSVGLSPRITPNQRAGIAFHWIAENIFMKHTRINHNFISYYESKINEENLVRPDNTIIVNKDFHKLSRYTMQIPLNIKSIHIDYYLIHSSKRSQYKFDRGYQSKDSIVILVPLNIKKSKNTQYMNIKILSVYDFCDFIGFSDDIRREFIHLARLALGSIRETEDSLEKLSNLEQKAEHCKHELKTNPKINFSI